MDATTLHLANGVTRTVKGRAEDIGAALKGRTLGADDGMRTFVTTDGDTITVATGAVMLAERAAAREERAAFGFARALA